MTLNSHFLSGFIVLTMLFATSCQKAEPHRTQSEYFNSLLDSAPIHVIDIDTPTSDTLYFSDEKTFCVDGLLGDQGVRSIANMHLFNDSINVLADVNAGKVWAVNNLGHVTSIASAGKGPGEILIPTLLHVLGDTLFVYDMQFVHAFDKNLTFMYRFQNTSYASPLSKMLINPTLYLAEASVNDPGGKFKVFERKKGDLNRKNAIFDLVIDSETSVKFRLPFNGVTASLSKYENTLLFYYNSSPYVFISDENGKISDILRLESPELIAFEPTYSEADYLLIDKTDNSQGDLVPDKEKISKFSVRMTDFQHLENGDIQFIYKDRNLITLTYENGIYSLAKKQFFSYSQNKPAELFISSIFRNSSGTYFGFSRSSGCIVSS
jgi:hypothetical protein